MPRNVLRGVRWCPNCRVFRDRDVNAAENILAIYEAGEERPDYLTRGNSVNQGLSGTKTVYPYKEAPWRYEQ
jgi:transposase